MSDIDYNKLAAALAAQQPHEKSKSAFSIFMDIGALIALALFLVMFYPVYQPALIKMLGGAPSIQVATTPPAQGTAPQVSAPRVVQPAPVVIEQAPAPPAPIEAAPAGVDTRGQPIPTAVVIQQAPVVEVVPQAMPQEYAPGSDIRQPTVEVLPYPTPLADPMVGAGVSADGKCVQAERGGKLYQVCQAWKYQPHEAASMADYLRTGLVPGEEVK